jgi:hypothetical protein
VWTTPPSELSLVQVRRRPRLPTTLSDQGSELLAILDNPPANALHPLMNWGRDMASLTTRQTPPPHTPNPRERMRELTGEGEEERMRADQLSCFSPGMPTRIRRSPEISAAFAVPPSMLVNDSFLFQSKGCQKKCSFNINHINFLIKTRVKLLIRFELEKHV